MSRPKSLASVTVALLSCVAAASAQESSGSATFNSHFLRCTGSLKDELYTCEAARIWDETIEITAATAESKKIDFQQNEWRLIDEVLVSIDSARLSAESASFVFAGGELIAFELVGSPAMLTDFIAERDATVSGSANRIAFDKSSDTVRMTGDVTFKVDDDEIATDDLAYNLGEQSFVSGEMQARLGQPGAETEPNQPTEP